MTRAKVFKSGNSQAVRLPLNMRLDATEVDIIRHGNTLILRPIAPVAGLEGAFDALTYIQVAFLPNLRDQGGSQDREAL
ncbi:hypothetical protein GCM10008955_39960 [Deinococcus malanensis]|uniref:SpoVT-AbrB domain-containing protein n=1 Tax=Deinococcus malanensis TaxID=1706855 RepID=A0ABQ2F234_9DEIO|nr:AbrB/MazE/SpoVT family DNA-binding domain-containing protein [Deinococcus malanensis]GGK42210.1 hypothetical protein GCM10008955_39960 [Deinococcus malanensis]